MRIYVFPDEPERHLSLQGLIREADFTDDEFDAVAALEVNETWSDSSGEFQVKRLPDEPAKLPNDAGRIDDPRT